MPEWERSYTLGWTKKRRGKNFWGVRKRKNELKKARWGGGLY